MMKTHKLFSLVILLTCMLAWIISADNARAEDFNFQWEINPLNYLDYLGADEKIVEYRIYYSNTKGSYTTYWSIPNDPANPTTSYSNSINPDPPGAMYFVIAAVDGRGVVGHFSHVTGTATPVVTSVTPARGSKYGGSKVTINGEDLYYGAEVRFDTDAATGVNSISETALTSITPAHAVGLVNVTVENPSGKSDTLNQAFEYIDFGVIDARVVVNSIPRDVTGDNPIYVQVGDDQMVMVADGAVNKLYSWRFANQATGGSITYNTSGTNPLIWTVPSKEANYVLRVFDRDNPNDRYQEIDIIMNNRAYIVDRPSSSPLVVAGSASDFRIAGGEGDAVFEWTIYNPVGSEIDTYTGRNYTFTAPSTGAFAGYYTVSVTDSEAFNDEFQIQVGLKVEQDKLVMFADETLDFHLKGASVAASVALYNEKDVNVTGTSDYGNFLDGVTGLDQPGGAVGDENFPDEVFAYQAENADNDADTLDRYIYFTTRYTVPGLSTARSSQIRVIPIKTFSGTISNVDQNETAVISVTAPALPAGFSQSSTTPQSTVDGGDVNYAIDLPFTGDTYHFLITSPGKISHSFLTANIDKPYDITLVDIPPAAVDYKISGEITNGVGSSLVNVYKYDGNNYVLVNQTVSDISGNYVFQFDADPGTENIVVQAIQDGFFGGVVVPQNGWAPGVGKENVNIVLLPTTSADNTKNISTAIGGIYDFEQVPGAVPEFMPVTVSIPPGITSAPNLVVEVNEFLVADLNLDPKHAYLLSRSGNYVYEIIVKDPDPNKTPPDDVISNFDVPILITVPFDLEDYTPNSFTNKEFVIRRSDTSDDLSDETTSIIDPNKIINADPKAFYVDPIFNFQLGRVTYLVSSLSIFGIGSPKPPDKGVGDAGGGGGCFIATTAYGSYDNEYVLILREFRDKILWPTQWGRSFVEFYYQHSPPVAEYIKDREFLKTVTRVGLMPAVGISWVALRIGVVPAGVILFLTGFTMFLILVTLFGNGSKSSRRKSQRRLELY